MSDKWCPEIDGAYRAELAYIEKHAAASRDAAEITRLRADLAAAQEERDTAIVQRAAERLAALTAEKALAAAQEREQRMREFLAIADALNEQASHVRQGYSVRGVCIKEAMMELGNCVLAYDAARAAMRGEP